MKIFGGKNVSEILQKFLIVQFLFWVVYCVVYVVYVNLYRVAVNEGEIRG
jgi:preprotein translocase subunit SecG